MQENPSPSLKNSSSNEKPTDNSPQQANQKETQFKPGNTFGKGRPVGSKNKSQLALEAIGQEHAEALLHKMIQQGLEGDTNASKFVLERCWPARKGARIPFNFPPIHTIEDIDIAASHVLEEISQGNMSLEEGDQLTRVMEHKRQVMMMRDLMEQLSELKEKF